jgi:hypothetical protein
MVAAAYAAALAALLAPSLEPLQVLAFASGDLSANPLVSSLQD